MLLPEQRQNSSNTYQNPNQSTQIHYEISMEAEEILAYGYN